MVKTTITSSVASTSSSLLPATDAVNTMLGDMYLESDSSITIQTLQTGRDEWEADPFSPLSNGLPIIVDATPDSSSAIKKAFTKFHNDAKYGKDSNVAYLGEDTSFNGRGLFWLDNQRLSAAASQPSGPMSWSVSHNSLNSVRQSPLQTVHENVAIRKEMRMLKPLQGIETWESGRRYHIAPAAILACPLAVLPKLMGLEQPWSSQQALKGNKVFGSIMLGECLLSYMGGHYATCQRWSSCKLVLQQNFLLEYSLDSTSLHMPRGFAHLEHSCCYSHPVFNDALELNFYASPCSKADPRVLLIRLNNKEERDTWCDLLNRAANMKVTDLYNYDAERKLGHGQYATVYKAKRVGEKDYTCALKVFDKTAFWKRVVKGLERADTLVRETSVQATLTAKGGGVLSCLRIRGFFETSEQLVMELELLEGIDLFKHISSKGCLAEEEAAAIISDVLSCLEAMNRLGLAHRDIKPANVLMCQAGRPGPRVKVCDFGMATFTGVDGLVRGRCGTPGYVAPEIFVAGVHGGYGNKVDVFSAGVTLYVMLCGYEPFYGETDAELVDANKSAAFDFPHEEWHKISGEAKDLLRKMMCADAKHRVSAKEALQHPWLQRHVGKADGTGSSLHHSVSSNWVSGSETQEGCNVS
jgi:serine/threonine protein kinase